jgi:hypothetical protein
MTVGVEKYGQNGNWLKVNVFAVLVDRQKLGQHVYYKYSLRVLRCATFNFINYFQLATKVSNYFQLATKSV